MSERRKILFLQFLMIATGIVGVMSIEGLIAHFTGDEYNLQWYHPLSILLAALLCTIPSLFLTGFEEWPSKKFITRLIIHALVLYAVVAGIGYLFKWYTVLSGFIGISIGYFAVYVFVWVATIWTCKKEADEINVALNNIRDEE